MKKIIYKIIFTLSLLWLGILFSFVVNFKILYPIFIPDPEIYAVENIKTGNFFNLFFEISSDTGYHPEPSTFYFYFVYILGIVLGGFTAYKVVWKKPLSRFQKIKNKLTL